jgi:hypothetical protein
VKPLKRITASLVESEKVFLDRKPTIWGFQHLVHLGDPLLLRCTKTVSGKNLGDQFRWFGHKRFSLSMLALFWICDCSRVLTFQGFDGARAARFMKRPWLDWANYWATADSASKAAKSIGHLGPDGRGIDGALLDLEI